MFEGTVARLRWQGVILPIVLVACLGLVIYSNIWQAPFVFDDIHAIVENEARKSLDFSLHRWFGARSLPVFSYEINYRFGELNVAGYHGVNIVIHLVTTIAMFWLAYYLSAMASKTRVWQLARMRFSNHLFCALLVSLVFMVHPIQTQAVTYIVQRLASMATMFYVMALLFYVKFRLGKEKWELWLWSILSLLTTWMAMSSKEIAVTLPVAVVMIELFFFTPKVNREGGKKDRVRWWMIGIDWRWFLKQIPWLLPWIITILIVPAYILGVRDLVWHIETEPSSMAGEQLVDKVNLGRVGAVSVETTDISRMTYLLTQINVVRTYVRLVVLPINQNLDYDYPITTTLVNWPTILSLLLHVVLLGVAAGLFYRGRRLAAFGIIFFYLALMPESSVIPIIDVIFEHRLYLPMVGFALVAGDLGKFLLEKVGEVRWGRVSGKIVVMTLALVLVVTWSVATWRRNAVWADDMRLWMDVIAKSPYKARPHNNLGKAYLDRRMFDEAERLYKKELELDPDSVSGHNNLGSIYGIQGKYEEALVEVSRAIELRPDHDAAFNNRGNIYMLMGDNEKAREAYQKSIELNPQDAGVYRNLGDILVKLNRYEEAAGAYEQAISLVPDRSLWHSKLGATYGAMGRLEEAEQQLVVAVKLDPQQANAYSNLGNVYKAKGQNEKALQAYATFLQLKPNDPGVLTNIGNVFVQMGNGEKAMEAFGAALKADPEFGPAQENVERLRGVQNENRVL